MKRIVICCDGTWNSSDKENILRQAGKQPPYGPANVKRYLAGGGKITSARIAP